MSAGANGVESSPSPGERPGPKMHPSERLVFFTDAVVAIAMTLLILPLMESIADAPDQGDTLRWFQIHQSQLLSFVLSFVITGVFWRGHHRLFEHVHLVTERLIALNFAWMFTIVWLPIATSLSGAMHTYDRATGEYDRLLVLVYVGTLFVNSLLLYVMEVIVGRTPSMWKPHNPPISRMSEAVSLSMTLLFGLATLLALAFPQVNMGSLFLLFLTGPVADLINKRMKPLPEPVTG